MKGLKIDETGDIVVEHGRMEYVRDQELMRQKARQVLGTNHGEWRFNPAEGINLYSVLTKAPIAEEVENNIRSGLLQVDKNLSLDAFAMTKNDRHLTVEFTTSGATRIDMVLDY